MKLLITFIFTVMVAIAAEQGNPKKLPFETDRNAEALLQQKVNYESKSKSRKPQSAPVVPSVPASASETVKSEVKSAESSSEQPSVEPNQVVECKSGNEGRRIEVQKKGSGCEVVYTKKGESKVIAQQKLGNLRCDHVFQDLQSKLTKGGFTCESK